MKNINLMTYSCIKSEIMKKVKIHNAEENTEEEENFSCHSILLNFSNVWFSDFFFFLIYKFYFIIENLQTPHSQTVLLLLNSVQ